MVALCFTVSIVLCLFSVKKTLTRHLYLSELISASPSAHLEVFHDSSRLIFFSQHMDGTITPYNIFSRRPGYFADLHSTQHHPTIPPPHLPLLSRPPNQLPVITKEEAVHPLVIYPPKCCFYCNLIFYPHFTLKLTPR